MTERFVLRDEVFGGTLFDRKALRHTFVKQPDLEGELVERGISPAHVEHWQADINSLPSHLLYSPIRVYFETTQVCNLRCRHCFNASGKPDPNEMSAEEVLVALEGVRQDNIFDIRFTGGEFTMRPDWFNILEKAKDLGFAVSLNTNAVYDDPSIIDKLASLNLEQITISIDGLRDQHDYIRGKGSFDQAIESLKLLHEKGTILRTNTVLTKGSAYDMEGIIEAVAPYVQEMNFFHMRMIGRAERLVDEALSYQELYEFNKRAAGIVKNYPHINILFGSRVTRENSIKMNQLGLKTGGPDGFTRFNLLADGSLWAGGYIPYIDRSLELGNIKDEGYTTLQIWRNSPKLNDFRDFSETLVRRCLSCPELDFHCQGTNVEMELIKLKHPEIGNPYCIY